MVDHAGAMCVLLWSTIYLDHQSVYEIAEILRTGPNVARSIGASTLEDAEGVPDDSFVLQEVLSKDLKVLSESALARDDRAMAVAYGSLVQTCVRCHSAYASDLATREDDG